jgi:hypothetical protein
MSRADVKPVGYSGTPLPKKLGIREKYSVLLLNAPARFENHCPTAQRLSMIPLGRA